MKTRLRLNRLSRHTLHKLCIGPRSTPSELRQSIAAYARLHKHTRAHSRQGGVR